MSSNISIKYDLPKLQADLIALLSIMKKTGQGELSWFLTAFSHVRYDDPQTTLEIRGRVQNLTGGLSVLYLVALIEQYFPPTYIDSESKSINLWEELSSCGCLSPSDLSQLRAYRHVRHSFAHHPNGSHAKQNRRAFEEVMVGSSPLPGITSDGSKILVEPSASLQMLDVVGSVLQRILVCLVKSQEHRD